MTTSKVAAIEEKVLAAAREYANAFEAYGAEVRRLAGEHGLIGSATRSEPRCLMVITKIAEREMLKAARLLKQRRAKGEKK